MAEVKRYNPSFSFGGGIGYGEATLEVVMEEVSSGRFVSYEDYKALAFRLEAGRQRCEALIYDAGENASQRQTAGSILFWITQGMDDGR